MLEALSNEVKKCLDIDASELHPWEIHELAIEMQKQIGLLEAAHSAVLLEWDLQKIWRTDRSRAAANRLARETGISLLSARLEMKRARDLRTMPKTVAAYKAGTLSTDRVDLLRKANNERIREFFQTAEENLVELVSNRFFDDAKGDIAAWMSVADEYAFKDKQERFVKKRSCKVAKTFDGVVDVVACLDPIRGEQWLSGLEPIEREFFEADWAEARKTWGDKTLKSHLKRDDSQRRADAMVEMSLRSQAIPAGARKPKPSIVIVSGDERFTKLVQTASGTILSDEAVIPYLEEAEVQGIAFGGRNNVVSVSTSRFFRGAIRKIMEIKAGHCQHPSGCDVPASKCEGDHNLASSRNGQTSLENGQLLCDFHNRDKGDGPPVESAA